MMTSPENKPVQKKRAEKAPSAPREVPTVNQDILEDQLQRIIRECRDPRAGVFGPDSMVWKVWKHALMFAGAGRAALLQTAHPWVAVGVTQHSKVLNDPLGRFQRTFENVFAMIFGDLELAITKARKVHEMHARITGTLPEDSGAWGKGARYEANNVNALLWVHSTLWESSVTIYELVYPALTKAEKEQLYEESRRFAWLFGISDADLPKDWDDFMAYNRRMWESSELTVAKTGRDLNDFVMNMKGMPKWMQDLNKMVTAALLPPRLRDQFGLPLYTMDSTEVKLVFKAVKVAYPLIPEKLRYVPPYHEAVRRLKGKKGSDIINQTLSKAWVGHKILVN